MAYSGWQLVWMLSWRMMLWTSAACLILGAGLGGLAGLSLGWRGALVGAITGGLGGAIAGVPMGVAVSAMTLRWPATLRSAIAYYWVVVVTGAVICGLTFLLLLLLLLSAAGAPLASYLVPAGIASVGGAWASGRVATWLIAEAG